MGVVFIQELAAKLLDVSAGTQPPFSNAVVNQVTKLYNMQISTHLGGTEVG